MAEDKAAEKEIEKEIEKDLDKKRESRREKKKKHRKTARRKVTQEEENKILAFIAKAEELFSSEEDRFTVEFTGDTSELKDDPDNQAIDYFDTDGATIWNSVELVKEYLLHPWEEILCQFENVLDDETESSVSAVLSIDLLKGKVEEYYQGEFYSSKVEMIEQMIKVYKQNQEED